MLAWIRILVVVFVAGLLATLSACGLDLMDYDSRGGSTDLD